MSGEHDTVLAALRDQSRSARDLTEVTGIDRDTVDRVLRDLTRDKRVTRTVVVETSPWSSYRHRRAYYRAVEER